MAIKDWPAAERPREKLLLRGSAALSDAELLAIFLRTGVNGCSAVDLSRQLLATFGSLQSLLSASQEEFCAARGLGRAKFAQLQAVLEMARRHQHERLQERPVLDSAHAARDYLAARLRSESREVFAVLYLNSQHHLLHYEPLFHGTIDAAAVYPREVVSAALKRQAAALIVAHNHPSGVAEPSTADRRITDRLRQALDLVDIRLLDHFVVGRDEVVSFAERGWL